MSKTMDRIKEVIKWALRKLRICPHVFKLIGQCRVQTMRYMEPNFHIKNNWWSVGNRTVFHYECIVCGRIVDAMEDSWVSNGFGHIKSNCVFRSKNAIID